MTSDCYRAGGSRTPNSALSSNAAEGQLQAFANDRYGVINLVLLARVDGLQLAVCSLST
jgi:hypothetical protein